MELPEGLKVNPEKEETVTLENRVYACYAIETPLITPGMRIEDIVRRYAAPHLRAGDILLISEKMLACSQGKARPIAEIRPGFWAKRLCRHVRKTDYGIGLSLPETMQCAIEECGLPRILLASAVGALGRLLGKKGWFYRIAGYKAASVDGPCVFTIPPYNRYVVPAPDRPRKIAREMQKLTGNQVLIIDCNDIGGRILGNSGPRAEEGRYLQILQQNPLGQSTEQTPMGILRRISEKE